MRRIKKQTRRLSIIPGLLELGVDVANFPYKDYCNKNETIVLASFRCLAGEVKEESRCFLLGTGFLI